METPNKNIFPEIDLFPRLTAAGRFISKLIPKLPATSEIPVRGAEEFLEQQLFEADIAGWGFHEEI